MAAGIREQEASETLGNTWKRVEPDYGGKGKIEPQGWERRRRTGRKKRTDGDRATDEPTDGRTQVPGGTNQAREALVRPREGRNRPLEAWEGLG